MIQGFTKKNIEDFIEDFKVYKGVSVLQGNLNIDFEKLSPGQQQQLKWWVEKRHTQNVKNKKKMQRKKSWDGKKGKSVENSVPIHIDIDTSCVAQDKEAMQKIEQEFDLSSESSISEGEGVRMDLSDWTSAVANVQSVQEDELK